MRQHVAAGLQVAGLGLPGYWSNRERLPVPEAAPPPVVDAPDLSALPALMTAAGT